MIPTLEIDISREAPGIYLARALVGDAVVATTENYGDIESAIRGEANRAEGAACFIEFTYGGMSTGTLAVEEAQSKAAGLADRLVSQCAELHRLMDSGVDWEL
jgi:hypothetical protein